MLGWRGARLAHAGERGHILVGVEAVTGYVAHIDRMLGVACALFPAGDPPVHGDVEDVDAPEGPPGAGALGVTVARAAQGHRQVSAQAAQLHESIGATMAAAAADARAAAHAAAGVRRSARTMAAAVTPATSAPDGVLLLVSSMDEQLAAMQGHIGDTQQRLAAAAARLTQHGVDVAALAPHRA